jgi:plasmid stabilization system protein ParE
MSGYWVSEDAAADVRALWDYIDAERPAQADDLLTALEQAFKMLASFPGAGRVLLADEPPVRRYSVRPFGVTILYRRRGELTEIMRVAGRGRDLGALLNSD